MHDMITCGICGITYNPDDIDSANSHAFHHKFRNDLVLPKDVRDSMRRCATSIIAINRDTNFKKEPGLAKQVLDAVYTMMHMWYHEDHKKYDSIDAAFVEYYAELRKRHVHLRKLI